jgi:hypothetical protein
MSFLRLFTLLAGALFLSEPAVPTAPATVSALPKGVQALPVEMAQRIQELTAAAEKARGLRVREPITSGMVEPAEVKAKMAESVKEDLPPEKLAAYAASLKAFGLIPQDMDLGRALPDLLASQVVGFYDPQRKYLAIVRQAEGALTETLGPERAEEWGGAFENLVLVHELVHALQDQTFDLQKYTSPEPLSDSGQARLAVVEGDATLTMFNYLLGGSVEALPGIEKGMQDMMRNPAGLAELSAGVPGGQALMDAPAYLRETMLFSYLQGALFAMSVKRTGGQELLDRAFTQDPPRSTEQILHPEKWHTRRDDPVAVRLPDLSATLPGYRKVAEGQLGELGVRILLSQGLGERKRAETAAAGWGGDRFALYERDGRRVLAWVTDWDSIADAKEMRTALEEAGTGWRVSADSSASPRRIVAIRGELPAKQRTALQSRLAR